MRNACLAAYTALLPAEKRPFEEEAVIEQHIGKRTASRKVNIERDPKVLWRLASDDMPMAIGAIHEHLSAGRDGPIPGFTSLSDDLRPLAIQNKCFLPHGADTQTIPGHRHRRCCHRRRRCCVTVPSRRRRRCCHRRRRCCCRCPKLCVYLYASAADELLVLDSGLQGTLACSCLCCGLWTHSQRREIIFSRLLWPCPPRFVRHKGQAISWQHTPDYPAPRPHHFVLPQTQPLHSTAFYELNGVEAGGLLISRVLDRDVSEKVKLFARWMHTKSKQDGIRQTKASRK